MDSCWLQLVAIFLLILANGFFAATEYALISSRRSRILHLIQKGSKRARIVEQLHSNPDSFVAAIQVGMTLVGTLASVVGGATLVEHLTTELKSSSIDPVRHFAGSISIGIVVVSIAFATLVLGELVPKRLGMQHSEAISLAVAKPIRVFLRLAFVPVKILTLSSRAMLRLLRQDQLQRRSGITEDEIVQIMAEGRKSGDFSQTEHELVASIFEFSDRTVRSVMTPRTDISAINIEWPSEKAIQYITEEGFSRYPVYRDSIDNVIGLVYTKDIINILHHSKLIILRDVVRSPFFVPDSKGLSDLLRDFQRKQMHMAIVLDEFGGTAGLVTLEDIIEEIVGEIQDEHDTEERDYSMRPDGSAIVSSRMNISEFNKLMKTELPEDLADTVGGFIYTHIGRIPAVKQTIDYANVKFTVIAKTGHRIDKVRVVRTDSPSARS
jgi:putative hemolysin